LRQANAEDYIPAAPSARMLRIPPCFCIVPSTISKKQLHSTLKKEPSRRFRNLREGVV